MKQMLGLALLLTAGAVGQTLNFDSAKPGALPPGWISAMTHAGGSPTWEVLKDETAPSKPNVLAQTSKDKTGGRFPLAILDQEAVQNGDLSVKMKPVSGEVDRAGGLVWRYRDSGNYYVVRANALEDNVVLYSVAAGKRTALAPKGTRPGTYGVKHKVPAQVWSTLRVTFQEKLFTVYFDGQKLFEVEDATFPGPGKVGVWTKADSVTYFDDLQITRR